MNDWHVDYVGLTVLSDNERVEEAMQGWVSFAAAEIGCAAVQLTERWNEPERLLPALLAKEILSRQRRREDGSSLGGQRTEGLRRRARGRRRELRTRVPGVHQPEGTSVISEALAAVPGTIGFTARSTVDESPAAMRKTRLAVARAKEGDQDALRFLYVRYSHNVYGYVRSIVRDDHEAEDVTQHVFAKLISAVVKYDDRGVPFFAWLLRLAHNAAIDQLRANRLTPIETVLDPNSSSDSDIGQSETVRAALATLPEEQRQVVILRHLIGLTPGEIADRMGRTEGSIHGLHHRGRRALRRELARLESTPCTREVRQLTAA